VTASVPPDREAAVQHLDVRGNPVVAGRYCVIHEEWTCVAFPPDPPRAALDQRLRVVVAQQLDVDDNYLIPEERNALLLITSLRAAIWPLICQAREDGKAEGDDESYRAGFHDGIRAGKAKGRREAAEAIEAVRYVDAITRENLVRLARGAQPDEKERTDGQ
jgi:hypothetical protein